MKLIKKTIYVPENGDHPKYVVDDNIPEFYDTVVNKEGYFLTDLEIQELRNEALSNEIEFIKWLFHLDNGTTHYNPFTKAETESIGFSPYDCFVDGVYTVKELYDKWQSLICER